MPNNHKVPYLLTYIRNMTFTHLHKYLPRWREVEVEGFIGEVIKVSHHPKYHCVAL